LALCALNWIAIGAIDQRADANNDEITDTAADDAISHTSDDNPCANAKTNAHNAHDAQHDDAHHHNQSALTRTHTHHYGHADACAANADAEP
jgi:hypothetical protein